MAKEREDRLTLPRRVLKWGVSYLDDALSGIFANDLVLLGAPPGVGKTAMCIGLAVSNLMDGKRVHFIALEAHVFEIERRLKYRYFCDAFFGDENRPRLSGPINFKSWLLGTHREQTEKYEAYAEDFCLKAFTNLHTLYKDSKFTVRDFIDQVNSVADDTDLIITDHAHYFDWDDENENKALKIIVHTARELTQEIGCPIVLVGHLRKKDRGAKELAPGMDDFHGSSELVKVATKCVTIAPGSVTSDGKYITYFRASKDRLDSGPSRYLGITTYNPKKGAYDEDYRITWANSDTPTELSLEQYPDWARARRESSRYNELFQRKPEPTAYGAALQRAPTRVHIPD